MSTKVNALNNNIVTSTWNEPHFGGEGWKPGGENTPSRQQLPTTMITIAGAVTGNVSTHFLNVTSYSLICFRENSLNSRNTFLELTRLLNCGGTGFPSSSASLIFCRLLSTADSSSPSGAPDVDEELDETETLSIARARNKTGSTGWIERVPDKNNDILSNDCRPELGDNYIILNFL